MKNIYLFIVLSCILSVQNAKAAFIVKHHEHKIALQSNAYTALGNGITVGSNETLYNTLSSQIGGPRLHNRSSGSSRGGDRGGGGRHSNYNSSNNRGGNIVFGFFRILFSLFINTDRPQREHREKRQLPIVIQLIIFGVLLLVVMLLFAAAAK